LGIEERYRASAVELWRRIWHIGEQQAQDVSRGLARFLPN
jgi:hypothetical protein